MNKILAGLLITGAAVAVGVVAAKVIKSKNSAPDYDDDDMFDYPDPYDTDEDISFDLADELDATDADKPSDEAESVEEAAEETEEEVSDDKE